MPAGAALAGIAAAAAGRCCWHLIRWDQDCAVCSVHAAAADHLHMHKVVAVGLSRSAVAQTTSPLLHSAMNFLPDASNRDVWVVKQGGSPCQPRMSLHAQ